MNKKGSVPKTAPMPPAKTPKTSGFKTGVSGKVWGKQYDDWIPSLYLNPIRT